MTTSILNSFAKGTGQSNNSKSGAITGALMGKMAEGAEAIAAIGALALGQVNRFVELAKQAIHVKTQKLAAAMTIPFASNEMTFNAAINPAARAPGLGGSTAARKKKRSDE